jgi:hypothetical protein
MREVNEEYGDLEISFKMDEWLYRCIHEAEGMAISIRNVFETAFFSDDTTYSDFSEGCGLLTARRVRHIRFPLLWCPASADNR